MKKKINEINDYLAKTKESSIQSQTSDGRRASKNIKKVKLIK